MELTTTARNTSLLDLVQILKAQADVKYDVVAHSNDLRFEGGKLIIAGGDQLLTENGVTSIDSVLKPTHIFDEGIADKLGIPPKYLRTMRDAPELELLDHNVNTWLDRNPRKWFVRGFKAQGTTDEGIGRAFLTDSYKVVDGYDSILAVLKGIKETGIEADVVSGDLSERRMSIKVAAPSVSTLAPVLLRNYRSPFDDATPERAAALAAHGWYTDDEAPTVFAGFEFGTSETGGGAWYIKPRLIIKRCRNGLTIKLDALRHVHLGSKMDEGQVKWSDETMRKNVELITAQTSDAVRTFLDVDYITAKVAEIEERSSVAVSKPVEVIDHVRKMMKFTDLEAEGILSCFIKSGDATAGGVMQAVTAHAQLVTDPDRASILEDAAIEVLHLASTR